MSSPFKIPLVSFTLCVHAALSATPTHAAEPDDATTPVSFNEQVRPILSNYCFTCHGPDEEARQADLRLDNFQDATADLGGYKAISPGKVDESEFVTRIESDDDFLRMPPAESNLSLTPQQIDTLKKWVASGAKYEQHWSFQAVQQPEPPELPAKFTGHVRNPIDAFVLKQLPGKGLQPSPEGDKATLIRRVHLDLTGLPPSLAEQDRFFADQAPGAYERMVDRALDSPHFGEKWARHWLDQARYADSNGYTIDSARSIWPYRDWVIEAFRQDLPFDQFTIEQLAGDLLDSPTREQLVATGFHRNTLVNQEGGSDKEQFRNEAVMDRVNTTGAVWLGLTVGCAQCHTHKYDPLTQREYYQLFDFFNSAADANSIGPTLDVPTPEQEATLAELNQKVATAQQALSGYESQRKENVDAAKTAVVWQTISPEKLTSKAGAQLTQLEDNSILVSGENGAAEAYTIQFATKLPQITAVRLETLTDPSLPRNGPGRAGNGNFVLKQVSLTSGDEQAKWLHAEADHSQKNYHVTKAIDGDPDTGWAINVSSGNMNVNRTATFMTEPVVVADSQPVILQLHFGNQDYNIGRFRVSITESSHGALNLPDQTLVELRDNLERFKKQRDSFAKSIPSTMIMREQKQPRTTHLLIRGDFLRPDEQVHAAAPAFLPPMPQAKDRRRTRLDLARWIVDPANPLTSRVRVNRIWMRLFGQGLVETENDFGLQGTPPTHPQLLDWLASEFMQLDWSHKKLIRLIVTSATYRQASDYSPQRLERDPNNKWLSCQSRIRVDAEVVRDQALAASGLLHRKVGGKSVYPPQPEGVYAFTQRKASWPVSQGEDRYRRAMYTFFMRSAPHPMLSTFDVPSFNTTCTNRVRSNTPLQALTVANDEAMFEMALAFGALLHQESGPLTQKMETGFRRCFCRLPNEDELRTLIAYYQQQLEGFEANLAEANAIVTDQNLPQTELAERAAWTMLARLLLNLDEFITRP